MFKFYKCSKCGSIVLKVNDIGCPPSCCGEKMDLLEPNTVDAAVEKHVPAVECDGAKVTVKVGAVEHPMTDVHYISYIILETSDKFMVKELTAADKPEAVFMMAEGEKSVAAYEYCTLHGFWKAEI